MQDASSFTTILDADSAKTPTESDDTSVSSLFGGIVSDMQQLLEDHLHLLKLEVQDDLQKSKNAMFPMALGMGLILAASLLLLTALVGFVSWTMPSIPWFAWSGILGFALATLALILLMIGWNRWRRVHPLPDKTFRQMKRTSQSINQQINTESP